MSVERFILRFFLTKPFLVKAHKNQTKTKQFFFYFKMVKAKPKRRRRGRIPGEWKNVR